MDAARLFASVAGVPLPEAAARFVTAGFMVFPCVPGGKRPLTVHGFRDASTNPQQVVDWWSRWPTANIGLPTGTAGAAGVEVVDVDVRDKVSGFTKFNAARQARLLDGWAALMRTPSGGMHAYYPADPEHPQSSWQVAAAGIDFRGTGGYVIGPPSVIPINGVPVAYELIAANKTTPIPVDAARLRTFLTPHPRQITVSAVRSHDALPNVGRLATWVASLGEGERNRGLFWAACRLAASGTDPDVASKALRNAAEQAGLPSAEATTTIRSAYRTTSMRSTHLSQNMHSPVPRTNLGQVLP